MAKAPALAHNLRNLTPTDTLEVLSSLADTQYFIVLKRVVRNLNEHYKNELRKIAPTDPNLALKHSEFIYKSEGQNDLIDIVENARIELARRNKDRVPRG